MKKIAIYGKGGSGKSTLSANLSIAMARRHLRVIQIGCDPKRDSTRMLTGGHAIPSTLSLLQRNPRRTLGPADYVFRGLHDIACIEAGGPEPGVGCAGRGIITVFEMVRKDRVLDDFDVVLLDVLGDVVCGGFAAPLMQGMAGTVAIVVGETIMSMFAANNLARAIRRFERNGVVLAGLVANNVRSAAGSDVVRRFAERIGTTVIASIPHDERFLASERQGLPLLETEPRTPLHDEIDRLAGLLLGPETGSGTPLTPMDEDEFDAFIQELER